MSVPLMPPSWRQLAGRLEAGTHLVLGATPGSSAAFARRAVGLLGREQRCVALVAADPGQTYLGVPGCSGLALTAPWRAPAELAFTGVLERDLALPRCVEAARRLAARARARGARVLVIDAGGGPLSARWIGPLAAAVGAQSATLVGLAAVSPPADAGLEVLGLEEHRLEAGPAAVGSPGDVTRRYLAHLCTPQLLELPLDGPVRPGTAVGLVGATGACLGVGVALEPRGRSLTLIAPSTVPVEAIRRTEVASFELPEVLAALTREPAEEPSRGLRPPWATASSSLRRRRFRR